MLAKRLTLIALALVLAACSSSPTASGSPTPSVSPTPSPLRSPATPSATPTTPGQVPAPPQYDELLSVRMTSLSIMWAATNKRVLRSVDSGGHWTEVTPPDATRNWSTFFAVDDGAAWLAYSPFGSQTFQIWRTVDGGKTWSQVSGTLPGGAISSLIFVDRLHGWTTVGLGAAAGSEGVAVLRTFDGGATWRTIAQTNDPSTTQASVSGLSFSCDKGVAVFGSPAVGLLTQDCAGGAPGIYRTADGGFHWELIGLPQLGSQSYASSFSDPIFLTPQAAVMEGSYGSQTAMPALLVTRDGGLTWHAYSLPGSGSIDFESITSGWQLDDPLEATTDGGVTWHQLAAAPSTFKPSDMTLQFLGKGIAIAWSRTATFRTDDAGRTWKDITPVNLHT